MNYVNAASLTIVLFSATLASADTDLVKALASARSAFDDARLEAVQNQLLVASKAKDAPYRVVLATAESFLFRADMLRNDRMIRGKAAGPEKALRAKQKEYGKRGLDYAADALKRAAGDTERAQAERVMGELLAHQISGMMSGMRIGPKSKRHINRALSLAPDDPKCIRAIGLLYLNNPPVSGGNVEKAIETFEKCQDLSPDSDVYPMLLAQSYRKQEEFGKAIEAARRALELNPANRDAKFMIDALSK